MARVEITCERVGNQWIAEVVAERGGRRLTQRDDVRNLAGALAWVRTAVAEVDPLEAAAAAPDPAPPDPVPRRKREAA